MRLLILILLVSAAAYGQCGGAGVLVYNPVSNQFDCTAVPGAGLGSVTSVGLEGTANKITVTGASPITSSGSWTLTIPDGVVLVTPDIGAATGSSLALGGAANSCDGTAGCVALGQGTAPSGLGTTSIQDIAPAGVTSYRNVRPATVGTTGVNRVTVSGTTATYSNGPVVSADMNITSTTCTNQVVSAISAGGVGTCHSVVNADITNSTIDLTSKVTGVLPTANIAVALANQTSLRGNSMAAAAGGASIGQVIAHGAKALDFGSTGTGACATIITDTATGALSTDVVIFNANASIKAVTGYVPASTGGFSIAAFPSADLVSFEACNWTAGTVDPGSVTVNWMVIR